MDSNIANKLESAIEEVKNLNEKADYRGFVIISKKSNSAEFFQFSAEPDSWLLDFPVVDSNNNTVDQAEKMRKVVSSSANEISDGHHEDIFQAYFDPETDFVEVSKEIIETIWTDYEDIETEVDG